MPTSEEFVQMALAQKGDRYVFGTEVSPLDPDPDVFDCSELVQWAGDRIGLNVPDGSFNQYPWTSHISVDDGLRTRGALLFASPPGRVHHVAISLGDGTTIEARGHLWGVGTWAASGRFSGAGRIPGMTYVAPSSKPPTNRGGGVGIQPGASSKQAISFLQSMLNLIRAHQTATGTPRRQIKVDGDYENETKAAVAEFQRDYNAVFHKHLVITGGADPATCDAIAATINLIVGAR